MNTKFTQIMAVLAIAGGAVYGCDSDDINEAINTMFRATPPFVPENDVPNCLDRQGEVVGTGDVAATMRGFVPDALRWAVADVGPSTRADHLGVNKQGGDSRGQEYTEYYAVISPGLLTEDWDGDKGIALGQLEEGGRSVTENALPDEVIDALEDAEDGEQTVGACVFHSWHADVQTKIPACADNGCLEADAGDGSDSNFPFEEYGLPLELNAENFRMKVSFNSNRAAADLVEQCFRGTKTDGSPIIPEFEKGGNTEDAFFRGCMGSANLFGTEWRRSDPSVCAAANRLRECGCAIPGLTDGQDLPTAAKTVGDAVVPPEGVDGWYRGFKLGTWADSDPEELSTTPLNDRLSAPAGCRYVNIGEDSKTVMACRLTVDDFLEDTDDAKETCRQKYGLDVVVHVPVPGGAIKCKPDGSEANKSCGAMPWNIGLEGDAEPDEGEDPDDIEEPGNDCFEKRSDAGCSDDAVKSCVCGSEGDGFGDTFCCESEWDDKCISEAESCAALTAG